MLGGRGFSLKKKKKQEPEPEVQKPPVEPWEPPGPKLDPLTQLPPDIVQYLTNFLSVRVVLSLRRVCKAWKEILVTPALSGFWRRASVYAGVPPRYVRRFQAQFDTVDGVFHQARLHTDHIARIHPEAAPLNGFYPFESTSRCLYAGDGYFVRTLDNQCLEKEETVIGELCPQRRTIQKVSSIHTGKDGEVNFAAVFADHIVWLTSEGYWFKFSLESHTHSPLFGERVIKREDGDGVGFCRHCLFVIVANSENIMHVNHWKLRFFKVEGDDYIEALHRPRIPHNITQYMPKPVKPHLVSIDGCRSHRLVVQGGTGGCVFDVTHDSEEKKIEISKSLATLNPFYDLEIAVMVVTALSHFVLSPDERFVALLVSIVYPYNTGLCLYFFDLENFQRTLSVRIRWPEGFNDCQLLAVSELYAVLAVGHNDGMVKLVHCRSGDVISSFSPLWKKGLLPMTQNLKIWRVQMEGVHEQECLSEVTGKLNIVVLYHKPNGNLKGVFYDSLPPSLAELEDNYLLSDSENEITGRANG